MQQKSVFHYILCYYKAHKADFAWAFIITIKLKPACFLLLFYEKGDHLRNEKRYYA